MRLTSNLVNFFKNDEEGNDEATLQALFSKKMDPSYYPSGIHHKKGQRNTKSKLPVSTLLSSRYYHEEHEFWTCADLKKTFKSECNYTVQAFPISECNVCDLCEVHKVSVGARKNVKTFETAKNALGKYIRISVVMKAMAWNDVYKLEESCGLYATICDLSKLKVYHTFLERKIKPSTLRTQLASIAFFISRFFTMFSSELEDYTELGWAKLVNRNEQFLEVIRVMAGEAKNKMTVEKFGNSALAARVDNGKMMDLNLYKQFLESIDDRLLKLAKNLMDYEKHKQIPQLNAQDGQGKMFNDVCIWLQSSFVVKTEGQRRQAYQNVLMQEVVIWVKWQKNLEPTPIILVPASMNHAKILLKSIINKNYPYALYVRVHPRNVEKRNRDRKNPFFQWNLDESGVVVLLFYYIHLRQQFFKGFLKNGNQEENFTSIFYHTKTYNPVKFNSLIYTANKSFGYMNYDIDENDLQGSIIATTSTVDAKKENFTFTVLRRTFATFTFVEWKNCLDNEPTKEEMNNFLTELGRRMNTSCEELKITYIASQTTVDFSKQTVTRSNFAHLEEHEDGEKVSEDDINPSVDKPYQFHLPSPQSSSDSSSSSSSNDEDKNISDDGGGKMPARARVAKKGNRNKTSFWSDSEDEDDSPKIGRTKKIQKDLELLSKK